MTCAPRRANISPTSDLPLAMPPVRPTFSMIHRRVRRERRGKSGHLRSGHQAIGTAKYMSASTAKAPKAFLGALCDLGGEFTCHLRSDHQAIGTTAFLSALNA